MFRSTMGLPCQHKSQNNRRPLDVQDFDQHWWLVQSLPMHVEAAQPVGIEAALKRIADEY